jgi:hypothetical protein
MGLLDEGFTLLGRMRSMVCVNPSEANAISLQLHSRFYTSVKLSGYAFV